MDDLGQPLLDDRDLSSIQTTNLFGVDIGAYHLKSEMGKTCSSRQTDVSGADNAKHRRFGCEIVRHRTGRYRDNWMHRRFTAFMT